MKTIKSALLVTLVSIITGCTNVIPVVTQLNPWRKPITETPVTPTTPAIFKSTVTLENGQFVARGEDANEITSATLTNELGSTDLSVQKTSEKTVMAPATDSKLLPGKFTLNLATNDHDLGKFNLEILPASIALESLAAGPDRSVLMSEHGSSFWDTSIHDTLQKTLRLANRSIYPGLPGMTEPPVGSVDLVSDRASATSSHVTGVNGIALGGTANVVSTYGGMILGGRGNATSASSATIINAQSVTAQNHNEVIFGGSKEQNQNAPYTSIIHMSASTGGSETEVLLKFADNGSTIKFASGTAGSCEVSLNYVPSNGILVEGQGTIFFRNFEGYTQTFNKSNTTFKIGMDDYTVVGSNVSGGGFKVEVKNSIGLAISGHYIARLVCLIASVQ